MDDFVAGVGPLFGPDFVQVVVNDDTGVQYGLQIYPDAHNPELKAAGLPQQYYFQPQTVYLAKKQTAPADFDFGMTVFKGLMTSETTIGINPDITTDGAAEAGGGFCAFTTTFAIPESVLKNVVAVLHSGSSNPGAGRLARFFVTQPSDPEPRLGVVPITDNAVTIAVPDLGAAADGTKVPMYVHAQSNTKGSIEEHGYSSFLVTMNQFAAGAIAGGLAEGKSAFTVSNALKESFYINGVTATVHIDVDKVYDSFSLAVSSGGFFGIGDFEASAAWSNCLTSGGITTQIDENGSVLDADTKAWIDKEVIEMRTAAIAMVQKEIFDWDPSASDSKATADRGWFSSLFGGTSVSVKSDYQKRSIKFDQTIVLNETISVESVVSGDLNDLYAAVKADFDKYVSIVDIGKYFQKIQVAATCAVNFGETMPDGSVLSDPIVSVQLEAGYPDGSNTLDANGNPNLRILGQGFHYTLGSKDPSAAVEPAIWTAENPRDIVNLNWLRLDKELPNWPTDQVWLRQRMVFDGDDPRVNLSTPAGSPPGAGLVIEQVQPASMDHAPVLTASQVGYVFCRFRLDRQLPKSNITVTITPSIGGDTYPAVTVTKANQADALWEVFSDKYLDSDTITYTVDVNVSGGGFTDDPVSYSTTAPVTLNVPKGRVKYLSPVLVKLPAPLPETVATINAYIAATAD